MRNHLNLAMEVVLACCILHNIAIRWGIEVPEGVPEENDDNVAPVPVVQEFGDRATVRARGEVVKSRLREQMSLLTASERRKLNLAGN